MLNPQITAFMDRWTAEWSSLQGSTPQDRRAHFETVAANMALPRPEDVDQSQEHWIDSAAGRIRVRVFRHTSAGTQDCLIYSHGGAFMQGSPETHADITARIASWNRQTVISLDYALCPEHPFPAAFDQVCDVARWCRDQAAELGIDPDRIVIGGDSAGGNLLLAVALAWRARTGLPALRHLAAIYPCTEIHSTRPSRETYGDGYFLDRESLRWFFERYLPNGESEDWRASPMRADSLAGLPPMTLVTAGCDPLTDDCLAFAERMVSEGGVVRHHAYDGMVHGFFTLGGYFPQANAAVAQVAADLAEALAAQ